MRAIYLILVIFILTTGAITQGSDSISLSDDYLDFGEVLIGDEESDYIEITNQTSLIVEVLDVDLWGDNFDYYENCRGELRPDESCEIEIIFSPSEIDSYSAELEIRTNEDSYSVDIDGEGQFDD